MKRINPTVCLVVSILCLVLTITGRSSPRIFVDAAATGIDDGSSWTDAYPNLQDALTHASTAEKPVEVRVAQGVYKPDLGANQIRGDRDSAFELMSGVTLRGGYGGSSEPHPDFRDINRYETILSGDLAGDDVANDRPSNLKGEPTRAENSYHVVVASDTDRSAVIDGFTITSGHAVPYLPRNPMPYEREGGGMYLDNASPTVLNCTFRGNLAADGGGMYNRFGHPVLTGCRFIGNMACVMTDQVGDVVDHYYGRGGGVSLDRGDPAVEDCHFFNNFASQGGALYSTESNVTFNRCTFVENQAASLDTRATCGGGAVASESWTRSPVFTACVFSGNSADRGGGIDNHGGNPVWTECNFMGNVARTEGGALANASGDPLLVRCRFCANSAMDRGGALYNVGIWEGGMTGPELSHCVFAGNAVTAQGAGAGFGGGALGLYYNSRLTSTNCTFVGNAGHQGNTLHCWSYVWPSRIQMTNCILWDGGHEVANMDDSEVVLTFSTVQQSQPGEGNIFVDPCFVDPGYWDPNGTPDDLNDDVWVDGDYHLKSQAGRWDPNGQSWVIDDVTSPCIDAGDPNSPIGYEPFPNGGRMNMGAYGGTAEASKSYFGEPVCETIIAGDVNGDCIVDFLHCGLQGPDHLDTTLA